MTSEITSIGNHYNTLQIMQPMNASQYAIFLAKYKAQQKNVYECAQTPKFHSNDHRKQRSMNITLATIHQNF